jgi:hypothetical protein
MHRPHFSPYRPDRASIVIPKGRASSHGRRGDRYELTWVRSVTDDGDVADVFRQQRWDRTGRRHDGELPIDLGVTPAAMFASYVELYREIAEQADGVPAPGQLRLAGVER